MDVTPDGAGNITYTILAEHSRGAVLQAIQLEAVAVPEPSTYAAIFGAIIVGFSILRKRKIMKIKP